MTQIRDLRVRIFADGADYDGIVAMSRNPLIQGFTTNPTLMRKAGVTNYEAFARGVLAAVPNRPISFEVLSDDFPTMIAQGRRIASWSPNVCVKVPVTDTKGAFAGDVIHALSSEGILVNVTAVMTVPQVYAATGALAENTPAIISVFAGRIADTGIDPVPHLRACRAAMASRPKAELLWASPRELLNIFQAEDAGCDMITVGHDLLQKLDLIGKDLDEFSRETVAMFHRDATASAFDIETTMASSKRPSRRPKTTAARPSARKPKRGTDADAFVAAD